MNKRTIKIVIIITMVILGLGIYYFYNNTLEDKGGTESNLGTYTLPQSVENFEKKYDVIVIGGEPEGVAAAVSAARNGAKTLLIEKREELGGLFTYGMLNFLDIPQGADGTSVSRGIYGEWHHAVGGGNAFGIKEAKSAFQKLVDKEDNLTLSSETTISDIVMEGNQVVGVRLSNKHGEFEVYGTTFIDATQDADFSVMSGAPYFVGGEDIGIQDKRMAVTLMIHLRNVDWEKIKETAESEKFGIAEVNDQAAWGFSELHYDYEPVEENTRLRGLNLAKVNDEYFINALQIFGVDGLDEQAKQDAIKKGERETEHILTFLREEFPGFENAEIISFPTELYVRETRHILTDYQLPMSDVWTNRDHWDSIGMGAYPVDVQAQTPNDYGYVVSDPKQYAIPFRSLLPNDVEGLLVVGRSAGYSSLAAGSARVVPTGMAVGEAAGVAASVVVEEDMTFRELSSNKELINELRYKLDQQGAYVDRFELDYPYQDEWYDESIQTLMDYGLVIGGYTNELRVDEDATIQRFMNMVKGAIQRVNPSLFEEKEELINRLYEEMFGMEDILLDKEGAADVLVEIFFEKSNADSWQVLLENNLIKKEIAEEITDSGILKLKEMFAISASMIDYIQSK